MGRGDHYLGHRQLARQRERTLQRESMLQSKAQAFKTYTQKRPSHLDTNARVQQDKKMSSYHMPGW